MKLVATLTRRHHASRYYFVFHTQIAKAIKAIIPKIIKTVFMFISSID